jgi:SAM-dependent methyltransferase
VGDRGIFASAEAYDRFVGRYGRPLAMSHAAAAGVATGAIVLDVGCGPGALTEVLAEHVGAENVTAVEPSEAFAAACAARVPGVDVRVGTAERLPALGRLFDVVLSQLVVNFMSDAVAGVRAMRAAATAGGTVASCVWDYAEGMTLLRAFWDAALELDPAAPDEARTMRYCTRESLAGLWAEVGLESIETDELWVEATYADFDDLWAPFPKGIGPAGAYCEALDADARDALEASLRQRLGAPDGAFSLRARAWFVRGTT